MMLKKIQMTSILVLSMIFAGFFVASPRVSAATSSYLYSCPAGTTQFIVMEPESPFVTCWTDSNGNGAIEQSDEFRGPTRHISGEAESGYSVAEVTCANSEPKESARRFSCLDGSGPSVIIRNAQEGETPTGDLPERSDIDTDCETAVGETLDRTNCKIIDYLVIFIQVLSGLVGLVIIGVMIIGGIQYSTARGNPQAVAAAIQRITNAVLALVVFLFAFALLQWLVPGGVL